jgi:hypothetical protein
MKIIKIGMLLFFTVTLFTFASEEKKGEYQLRSGMILYHINGGGALAPDLNVTIRGKGKLRFRHWGKVALSEEEVEERTSGAFVFTETFTQCTKHDQEKQLNVDYRQQLLMERPIPKGDVFHDMTLGMTRHGEEIVAGKECDVWAKEGERICLYRGVPLLIERELFGISYEKRAFLVEEDINVSTEQCTLPNFPVRKIALFKTTIKQKKGSREISKHLTEMLDEVSRKESIGIKKYKQHYLNRLGRHIFEREKVLLPEMLENMKRVRECLQLSASSFDANACLEDINRFQMNRSPEEKKITIDSWNEIDKSKMLDELDEKIIRLESKMKCVRASKSIADLSVCMSQ